METILAISGKPGLYRLVSRGKSNLIVETLDNLHRRIPAFASDRVTSLGDIAMYTLEDDVPLWQVLKAVGEKEQSKAISINYRKCPSSELRSYFAEVLPNFDPDRVHDSDIKKLMQWYDLLIGVGITDFEATFCPPKEEKVEEKSEEQ